MDILSFVLGYKKGKATGGGGGGAAVDPVYTVTFMSWDGLTVLGQRSVVDSDNCADMVARGKWPKPTKESTPQYNYTYSGWSETSGGDADASALSAVTEDRTVYAAFTSAVRYYTITYLDDDGSVLKIESLAYGDMPSYTPKKDGYDFVSWSPNEPVTGNMSYTASWKQKHGISKIATLDTNFGTYGTASCVAIYNTGSIVLYGNGGSKSSNYIRGFMLNGETPTEITFDANTDQYWQDIAFNYDGSRVYARGRINNQAKGLEFEAINGVITSRLGELSPIPGFIGMMAASPVKDIYGYTTSNGFILSNGITIKNTSYKKVEFSPNGRHVAFASNVANVYPGVRIYDVDTGDLVKTITTTKASGLSYNNTGTMLAIALEEEPYVEVYNTNTWEKICNLSGVVSSNCEIAMMDINTLVVGKGTTVNVYTVTSDGLEEFEDEKPTYSGGSITRIYKNHSGSHIVFLSGSVGLEVWKKE